MESVQQQRLERATPYLSPVEREAQRAETRRFLLRESMRAEINSHLDKALEERGVR